MLNPKSLENLTHDGRPPKYGEKKKVRRLTVTEEGWQGVSEIASAYDLSVSEILELVGRGELVLVKLQQVLSRPSIMSYNNDV